MAEARKVGLGRLTKSAYAALERRAKDELGEETGEAVLALVRDVLKFDPTVSQYRESQKEVSRAWRRRRAAELGVTPTQMLKQGVARLKAAQARGHHTPYDGSGPSAERVAAE